MEPIALITFHSICFGGYIYDVSSFAIKIINRRVHCNYKFFMKIFRYCICIENVVYA